VEQVLHFKNWTFVAVDCIASKVASIVPNIAYVHDEPVKGVTTKAWARGGCAGGFGSTGLVSSGGHSFLTMGEYRSKALSVVKPHEDISPLPNDHELRRLVDSPNAVDTWFDLSYELQMFEDLTGVSYLWMVPNAFGMPGELWVLPSHWVWPRTGGGRYIRPDDENNGHMISHYEIRPWGGMGSAGTLYIPADEVVMTRWKSPVNKLDGYSKLGAIAQWIDSEESITRSRWAQFMNEARPEFWVKLPPGYEDPDDDRVKRIEAKIYAKLQGELNYGKPLVTGPGIEISPLSFNPTEMAYFSSEEQIRDMILSTFRVPKAAVGISSDMTYGSILATLAALCTYCLNPRLTLRGQVLTKYLASKWNRKGRRVRMWYDDCVPADPQQVNSDIQVDMSANAITPNEIRAMRGRKSFRFGGDDPLVQGPGGIMPLPLNTGEEQDELAALVAEYAKASQGGEEGGEGGGEEGAAPPEVGSEGQPAENPLQAMLAQQQKGYRTVAVDLDGTLLERAEFPNFGKPRRGAKEAMEALKRSGAEVAIWTVRDDADAVAEELRRHGIHFDSINNSGKKHLAEVYIDDRGMDGREDWDDIVKTLLRVDALIFAVEDHDKQLGLSLLSMGYGVDERDVISLEEEPHITLVSNLDADLEEVQEKLKGVSGVKAMLGSTTLFRTPEADVLIVPVKSDKLGELHRKVRELPNEWKHPAYQPHVTIAYLKPGTGHKYVGNSDVEGAELPLRALSVYNGRGDITERMQLV
jgi:phage portal protein BeeE/2'-5' RNA ligase